MNDSNRASQSLLWYDPTSLAWINLALGSVLLALGYILADLWYILPVLLLLSLAWYFAGERDWAWLTTTSFVLYIGVAATGFYLEVEPYWSVLGAVFILLAWDLKALVERYAGAGRIENKRGIVTRHMGRLVLFEGLGVILILIALSSSLRLSFGLLMLVGVIAVLALGYWIGYFLRTSE